MRRALPAGDYSVAGLEGVVAVERKTLDDFVSTVIHSRARFREELRKLAGLPGGVRGGRGGHPRCPACTVTAATRTRTRCLGSALSIILDYRIPVFFCSSRQAACQFVQAYLLGRTCEVECMTKAAAAEAQRPSAASWKRSSTPGPTFSAGRLRTPDGALVNFAGKVFARPSDRGAAGRASGRTIRSTAASSRSSVSATTWRWTPMAWPTSWPTIRT